MKGLLKDFISSKRGSLATAIGVGAVPLMMGIGAAVDYSSLYQAQASLKNAADAAALASARELRLTSNKDETIKNIAKQYVYSSLAQHGSMRSAEDSVNIDPSISDERNSVTVDLTYEWNPLLIHYISKSAYPIRVSSTASLAGDESLCVIALDESASQAMSITGSPSSITANDCAIYSNSNSSSSIEIVSGSKMVASNTYSGGGFSGPLDAYAPRPVTDSPKIDDPLTDRSAPSLPSCVKKNVSFKNGTNNLTPCVFEGGFSISGKTTLNLAPGTYVIKDGPMIIGGNSTLRGKNVGFYFTGTNATFDFGVSTQIDITAPNKGEMAGILFFEDRSSPVDRNFVIRSKDAERLEGTIYLSRGRLIVDKASRVGQKSNWTAVIANKIEIREGPQIEINSDYGASTIPVPDGIGATGDVRLTN